MTGEPIFVCALIDTKIAASNKSFLFRYVFSRYSGKIRLHKTTFWTSPDRDSRSAFTIELDDPENAFFGAKLTNAAINLAIGEKGDTNIVLGFANKEYVARKPIAQHCKKGATLAVTRTVGKKKKRAVKV
jgi:hypothetical protein